MEAFKSPSIRGILSKERMVYYRTFKGLHLCQPTDLWVYISQHFKGEVQVLLEIIQALSSCSVFLSLSPSPSVSFSPSLYFWGL